jgi:hypothetical protein
MDCEMNDEPTNTKNPAIPFHRDDGFFRFRSHRGELKAIRELGLFGVMGRLIGPPEPHASVMTVRLKRGLTCHI